jgi:hypothetical protein
VKVVRGSAVAEYQEMCVRYRDLVGKVERRGRKPWITKNMISKINKGSGRISTTKKRKNYRRVKNELKSANEKAEKEYLESICDETIEYQRGGCYDFTHVKTEKQGCKENHGIQIIGAKNSQGNIMADLSQVPKTLKNYITERHDRANRPENLQVETEKEVD